MKMKRSIVLILSLAMIFAFSFAGTETASATENEGSAKTIKAVLKADTFRYDGNALKLGDILDCITVYEPEKSRTSEIRPKEGEDAEKVYKKYFVFEFSKKSGGAIESVESVREPGEYFMLVKGRDDSDYSGLTAIASFSVIEVSAPEIEIRSLKKVFPDYKVTWKAGDCDGYELLYTRSDEPGEKRTIRISDPDKTSYTIKGLKNGITLKVKVRAYVTDFGKTVKGEWSDVLKAKTVTTGWKTVDGRKFYYKNGSVVKGQQTISGNPYYFDSNGEVRGITKTMWKKVKAASSKTDYYISVDTSKNRFCVYMWSGKEWYVKMCWICSTGKKATPTVKGTFSVLGRKSNFGESKGYSCWYCTRFYKDYYIHSEKYKAGSKTKLIDGRMGKNVSEGCIRLPISKAKWVYSKIKNGTGIYIY